MGAKEREEDISPFRTVGQQLETECIKQDDGQDKAANENALRKPADFSQQTPGRRATFQLMLYSMQNPQVLKVRKLGHAGYGRGEREDPESEWRDSD